MADDIAQTPESVALNLLHRIADAEDWNGMGRAVTPGHPWKKSRAEILDVYAECLSAAKGSRSFTKST